VRRVTTLAQVVNMDDEAGVQRDKAQHAYGVCLRTKDTLKTNVLGTLCFYIQVQCLAAP
jgi:hypothetical protein